MIPVTSFAGKTVAVFGLGGSGLASCHALKAGGAEVIAGDDSADNVAKAAQAGFTTADLRTASWTNFSALILTPGAPLTHRPGMTVERTQIHHRSFKVERPASASMTEMIQNRITICGSVQPFCSK